MYVCMYVCMHVCMHVCIYVSIVTERKCRCEVVESGIDKVNQNESWIEFIVDYYREVTKFSWKWPKVLKVKTTKNLY